MNCIKEARQCAHFILVADDVHVNTMAVMKIVLFAFLTVCAVAIPTIGKYIKCSIGPDTGPLLSFSHYFPF